LQRVAYILLSEYSRIKKKRSSISSRHFPAQSKSESERVCLALRVATHATNRPTAREYRRSLTVDDDVPTSSSSSSSSYFWRSLVGLDHHTPWWGSLRPWTTVRAIYGRVATHGHFVEFYHVVARYRANPSRGITPFPHACLFKRDHIFALDSTLCRAKAHVFRKTLAIFINDTISHYIAFS